MFPGGMLERPILGVSKQGSCKTEARKGDG